MSEEESYKKGPSVGRERANTISSSFVDQYRRSSVHLRDLTRRRTLPSIPEAHQISRARTSKRLIHSLHWG